MHSFFNTVKTFFKSVMRYNYGTNQSLFNISYLVIKNLIVFFLLIGTLVSITLAGVGIGFFANIISHTDIPSEMVMKAKIGQLNQASSLLFNDGQLIAEVQSNVTRHIVDSNAISDYVKKGLIATEDSSFYEHSGIVPKSVFRAVFQEVAGASQQTGGSTLTQQLVKQQLLSNEVTFSRKAKEMLLAMRVEKYFSKDDILTAYLNVSSFGRNSSGQNIAGIEAAAQGVFGVSAKDLSLVQAAFLVGLPQSPYYYTPYTNTGVKKENMALGIARMKIVLQAMRKENYITQDEFNNAIAYDITKDFIDAKSVANQRQNHLYQAVRREAIHILMKQQIVADGKTWEHVNTIENVELYNTYYRQASQLLASGGYRVHSTVDKILYDQLQQSAQQHIHIIDRNYETTYTDPNTKETKVVTEMPQTGTVVIENATGKILAFVGGPNFENSQMDHAFATRRSPGSTIKPLLVFAPAFENHIAYPATQLADFAIVRSQPNGMAWKPTNAYGGVSNKFITARDALVESLNNPTIHLYSAMLANQIDGGHYMQAMGVDGIDKREYYNEAASVGGFSSGPTVAEQTGAYTTFANDGKFIANYLIEKIEDKDGKIVYQHEQKVTPVFSDGTAFIMRSILQDSIARGTTRLFPQHLNFKLPQAFGKTGTSDENRDLWVIVSTPRITVGQWVGFDNNYGVIHNLTYQNSNGYVWERSQRFFAYTLNAINHVKPDLFNTAEQFSPQPSSVITSSVLKTTGTAPGDLEMTDNSKIAITGDMHSDYFLKARPAFPLSYYFSPGASDDVLDKFWKEQLKTETETSSESKKTEESETSTNTTSQTTETSSQR